MRTLSTPTSVLPMLDKMSPVADGVASDPDVLWQAIAEVLLAGNDHHQLAALCDGMLAHRPNHLDALYYRARLAMARGDHAAALPVLERVLKSDPEHWAARFAYGTLLLANDSTLKQGIARCLEAVTQGATLKPQVQKSIPSGIAAKNIPLRPANMQEQWEKSYQAVLEAAGKSLPDQYTDLPREQLVAMMMLESLGAGGALGSGRRLAHKFAEEQPNLVKPRLLLAEWYTAEGDIACGMNYLHDAKVLDPGGRVARRLALPMLTIAYSMPVPDSVSAMVERLPADVKRAAAEVQGWQAPAPLDKQALVAKHIHAKRKGGTAPLTPSPAVTRIQHDLVMWQQRLLAPKSQRTQAPTAEIVVTARQPFVKLYGVATAETILEETAKLVAAINRTNRIHAHLVVLDDVESVKSWGAERVEGSHAAAVKTVIDRVDEKIEASGEQAGFVLIVGGDAVVPFHRLPNPVDDHDPHVPSDNPYAASGEEYMIPTRAVGRLPHDRHSPDLLLNQLRRLQDAWRKVAVAPKTGWMGKLSGGRAAKVTKGEGWGYAADIWSAAAKDVFKVVESKSDMHLCPPVNESQWKKENIPSVPFYYFNLHGVQENGNYYGQSTDLRATKDDLYPTALTPAQFAQLSLKDAVILSEACYGTNPGADTAAGSLALTALQQGALLFVGSTNASYASLKPPLMAADLLAALFWKAIGDGLPGGAALQKAKIELARTMQNPNDYVDVEEQKALLSFVLYGDPALPLDTRPRYPDTSGLRQKAHKTMAESKYQLSAKSIPNQNLDPTLQKAVLSFVAPYTQVAGAAPKVLARPIGFADAPPTLSSYFSSTATLPKSNTKWGTKNKEKWHITVSQPIAKNGVLHQKVITLTMDDKGKVIKSHTSK